MNALLQDIRHSLRTFAQHPSFAAIAVLTLALGTGATTVMFTVASSVLLKPLAYPHPEQLVTLHVRTDRHGDTWGFSHPDFLDVAQLSRSFDGIAAWAYAGGTISAPGEPEYVDSRQISSELFSVLSLPLIKGRAFTANEDRAGGAPVAIISSRLWQQHFAGNSAVIGSNLNYDGKTYTVVGVAPPSLRLDGDSDVFIPLAQSGEVRLQNRNAHYLHVVARLRAGVTLAQAQTELGLISQRLASQYPQSNRGLAMVSHPLQQEVVQDVQSTLWLLLGAVSLLLLIACVNVANLLLARAASRRREFAMRLALGAAQRRLLRQCLTESTVLAICGGLLGLLIAKLGIHPFLAFWPGSLPRTDEVGFDWRVLLFALGASLACSLVFGMAPALRARNSNLEEILRAGARNIVGNLRSLHHGFVVSEIAIAVVLLVSAGILAKTLLRLSSVNPGVDVHGLLTARVALSPSALTNPARARAAWQDFVERARSVPGVKSVALTDIVPLREGENVLGYWTSPTSPPPSETPSALASSATPDFLSVMGIPLLRGRFFNDNDRLGNQPVVVIDQNLAKHAFGNQEPVGKRLWVPGMGAPPVLVVGVVGHVRHWSLAGRDDTDQLYYPFTQVPDDLMHFFSSVMSVTIRTDVAPLTLVPALQREMRGVSRDQALYDIGSMEQLISASLARQRFLLFLFGIFATLALLLACVGVYGVIAYLTSQRVPEIGVRMALGASASAVLRLVIRQSLVMISAGIAAGIPLALVASRLLQSLVPGARMGEPSTFFVMILLLFAAALSAGYVPARRAAKLDPMVALRYE
ncbi:MAG TPA: ABC transporter permease [Terriglobales bacterium]|nr:ABC transporter permease [Terriglobales bacterium]